MRLSIILPTYNEAENMEILIPKLILYCSKKNLNPSEIFVMDDKSPDGTAKIARKYIADASKKNIKLIIVERKGKRGLTPAVIDGMRIANGKSILIMDSDLSHPITAIKDMVSAVQILGADLSIGSRNCPGGSYDPNWPSYRKLISFFSSLMGRLLDWRVTDPMAGFFCCSRKFIEKNNFNTLKGDGFKILLEIVVKFKPKKIIEIPIIFNDRIYGESKMKLRVMWKYIIQLIDLYKHKIIHKIFKN
ncbi:MAG: glycosyltransferase [Candidatus Hodarchaeota archaeon]